jgi:hypothetical protein
MQRQLSQALTWLRPDGLVESFAEASVLDATSPRLTASKGAEIEASTRGIQSVNDRATGGAAAQVSDNGRRALTLADFQRQAAQRIQDSRLRPRQIESELRFAMDRST